MVETRPYHSKAAIFEEWYEVLASKGDWRCSGLSCAGETGGGRELELGVQRALTAPNGSRGDLERGLGFEDCIAVLLK